MPGYPLGVRDQRNSPELVWARCVDLRDSRPVAYWAIAPPVSPAARAADFGWDSPAPFIRYANVDTICLVFDR